MSASRTDVRVRVAPSPTGKLHLGTARTALFNLLFARHNKGKFLIRIEDTDKERSSGESEEEILTGLKWLGIESDEEVIRQSERGEVYKKYVDKLIERDRAYFCYCSKEELEGERESMMSQGLAPKYNGRCRGGKPDRAGEPQLVRLRVPEKKIIFKDMIRGRITFDTGLIGDFPISRGDKSPLYNLAVVVDDLETNISQVIRGEDHISNTPKQILIAEALEIEPPHYAHIPLILSPEGGKLSKRAGDTISIADFKKQGYLPAAMVNFIAYLGWHPKTDKEVMDFDDLVAEFDLERAQKSGAVFNQNKLDWLNAHYIKQLSSGELKIILEPFIPEAWREKEDLIDKAVEINKDRMKKLGDIRELGKMFFELEDYEPELLRWKEMADIDIVKNLESVLEIIKGGVPDHFEEKIVALAEERGRGEIFWPMRVALSGQKKSPPPLELVLTLGQEESIKRLEKALIKTRKL